MKKEDLARKVGKRIVQLREKKGWSQSDLARACMKDRQNIERIESGKTNPTLFTLAWDCGGARCFDCGIGQVNSMKELAIHE
ncbi:MAG: helix-turn-helix transcriptional regulator [Bacteroidota bacterium]